MDKIASAKFRTTYTTITEPVTVTVNGHAIGTWLPLPFSPQEFRTDTTPPEFVANRYITTGHPFGTSHPAPKPAPRRR